MRARDVACPKCGAGNGEPCRTLATNRATDIHVPRLDKFHEARRLWWKVGPSEATR